MKKHVIFQERRAHLFCAWHTFEFKFWDDRSLAWKWGISKLDCLWLWFRVCINPLLLQRRICKQAKAKKDATCRSEQLVRYHPRHSLSSTSLPFHQLCIVLERSSSAGSSSCAAAANGDEIASDALRSSSWHSWLFRLDCVFVFVGMHFWNGLWVQLNSFFFCIHLWVVVCGSIHH